MPSDSVAIDLHKVQTLFQAIDHYLVAQESHGPDAPELESADLGTEFTDFAVPLRDHYAQLHADQVARLRMLRRCGKHALPRIGKYSGLRTMTLILPIR